MSTDEMSVTEKDNNLALRRRVYAKFQQWAHESRPHAMRNPMNGPALLYHLLRGKQANEYGSYSFGYDIKMNEQDYRLCEALAGENGYTIYRSLLTQRGPYYVY